MKKFIVFCLILIVTVSLGVTVWYFVRDNEELVINMDSYVYRNTGESLEIDAELKHAKVGNELIISSLNENVLKWNPYTNSFDANQGGVGIIEIKPKKGNISPVYIQVSVGDGSETMPYYIDEEDDLLKIGDGYSLSANFILMQDITLTDEITPIGHNKNNGTDSEFTGEFNGNGYAIRNLEIDSTLATVKNAGLFAKIGATGVVSNLTLSGVNVSGTFETAGAVAGINKGTITRCYVENGTINSDYVNNDTNAGASVGGICGISEFSNSNKGRVDRCSSNLNVVGTENVGGLVGYNNGAIIINSYAKLTENGYVQSLRDKSNIGGLVGLNACKTKQNSTTAFATVKNCYFVGKVELAQGVSSSSETFLAQLIGLNVENDANFSNNLMGLYAKSDNTLVNNKITRNVTQDSAEQLNFRGYYGEFPLTAGNKIDKGQLKSYMSRKLKTTSTDITSSDSWEQFIDYWDFINVWDDGTDDIYPVLRKDGANVSDDISMVYNPNEIKNESDFRQFVSDVNNGNAKEYYILTNDIVLTGEYTPAGTGNNPFNGTFEGNGKTISGVQISSETIASVNNYAGLFASTTTSAVIQNLIVKDIQIEEGAIYAGGIVANNKGFIKNCTVTQTNVKFVEGYNIIGSTYVGGIAGNNVGTIDGCRVQNQTIWAKSSSETKARFVGGIAGINGALNSSYGARIQNCGISGSTVKDVLDKNDYDSNLNYNFKTNFNNVKYYVGGIAGVNFYLIDSNYVFETDVEMNKFSKYGEVAGIVAYSKSESLMNSNTAEVVNNRLIGGNITGYIAAGLVCEQYGRIEYNQIGAGNEKNGTVTYVTNVTGAEIAGLVNKINNGGRLFNCFVGVKLINTMQGTGHSAGFCNVNDYYAYNRWFGEDAVYGQFGQLFSLCTFENTEYWHCRYDCNMDYRYEAYFIRTPRNTGYGNNVIWIETSANCSYDDSPELLGFINESKQMNIKRLDKLENALVSVLDNELIQTFTSYGFDSTRWTFEEMDHPYLNELPKIEELGEI